MSIPKNTLDILKDRTVYLAGPMSGYPENNFPAFHAAAARLRDAGVTVISPAEKPSEHEAGSTLSTILAEDIQLLSQCGAVVLLPGYQASRGATIEILFASYTAKPMWELDGQTVRSVTPGIVGIVEGVRQFAVS